ncbi:MAG: histidine triad nucleotide-binding protein [Kiritimatiellia bacterium]
MATQSCIFCRIAASEIPSDIIYQDDDITAFRDIQPVAPVHIVVIPKLHIPALAAIQPEHVQLLGKLLLTVKQVAAEQGLAEGYRVVVNSGVQAGQSVPHLHFHILGGRTLGWPPG